MTTVLTLVTSLAALLIAAWHVHGLLRWRGRIRLTGSLRRWLNLNLEIDAGDDDSSRR